MSAVKPRAPQWEEVISRGKQALLVAEEEKKLGEKEKIFQSFTDRAGPMDVEEVVERFLNQGELTEHLEKLKKESEERVSKLREERDSLEGEKAALLFASKEKRSSQVKIEELEEEISKKLTRQAEMKLLEEQNNKLMNGIRTGVQHILEALSQTNNTGATPVDDGSTSLTLPSSPTDLLEQMNSCCESIKELAVQSQESDELAVDSKITTTQVTKVTTSQIEEAFKGPAALSSSPEPFYTHDDDSDSGDGKQMVPTRSSIKQQAKQLVETHSRAGNTGKRGGRRGK